MNVKKRKVSEESEESPDPGLMVAGRQRRAAAQKSHKVWDQLKPGAKPNMEEEQTPQQLQAETPDTTAKRTRLTPNRGASAGRKSVRISAEAAQQMGEAVKNEAKTEQPAGDEEGQQPMPTLTKGGGGRGSVRITSSSTTATRVSSTSPQKIIVSGQKSAMSNEQLEMIEREMEKHHQFDEPEGGEEGSDEDEEHQQARGPARYVLDDDERDEDFVASGFQPPSTGRGSRGGGRGRGRGSRGGVVSAPMPRSSSRGRPRGSRAAGPGSGVMRGRLNYSRPPMSMNYFSSPQARQMTNGIYSLQPAGGIIGELAAARQGAQPGIRILRPAGMPLSVQSNFQSLRPSSMNIGLSQPQLTESNFAVNRELENFRNRIVPNASVQQFNDTIDHILDEYQRVVDDRSRLIVSHREYVNHLKLTHQAAQDIKDNKIRHLEQTVEQLQQKVMAGIKQEQLRVVKQGSMPAAGNNNGNGPEVDVTSTNEGQPQQQQFGGEEGQRQGEAGGGQGGDGGAGTSGDESQPGGAQIWGQQQQRIRIVGMPGAGGADRAAMPRLHNPLGPNASYYDDQMDEEEEEGLEEFEGDEDSAEMDEELGAQVTI